MTEETEGTQLSDESIERVRGLLDPASDLGRVCLRMLDGGDTVGDACMKEGLIPREIMRQWHELTDGAGIRCTDGRRPCISTLANAWKARWSAQDAPLWMPVDAPITPQPFLR